MQIFTTAKIWKQPKCPPHRWMGKNMGYKHTREYSSAIDKSEILPSAVTRMNLERTIQSEVSQTNIPGYRLYVEAKIWNKWTYLWNRLTKMTDMWLPMSRGQGLPWWLRWLKKKNSTCNAGDLGSIPGWGRAPGGGHGDPLQYSCLENPMDRGAWQPTVHGVTRIAHDLTTKPLPLKIIF